MSKNKEELNEALKAHLINAINILECLTSQDKRSITEAIADKRTKPIKSQLPAFFETVTKLGLSHGVVPSSDSKIMKSLCDKYAPKNHAAGTFAQPRKETEAVSPKKPTPKKGRKSS